MTQRHPWIRSRSTGSCWENKINHFIIPTLNLPSRNYDNNKDRRRAWNSQSKSHGSQLEAAINPATETRGIVSISFVTRGSLLSTRLKVVTSVFETTSGQLKASFIITSFTRNGEKKSTCWLRIWRFHMTKIAILFTLNNRKSSRSLRANQRSVMTLLRI